MSGHLYYGDNLEILKLHIKDDSVDLVYLDPPFKSDANYNVLFKAADGEKAPAQIKAFDDTWTWDTVAAASLNEMITEHPGPVADTLVAFKKMMGPSSMLAYLAMMAPRLVELQRVLKPTGSIYLHCDPTASHYLKLLMDAVFGGANFQNEIIWCYRGGGVSKKRFARKHDVLLFYALSKDHYFEPQYVPYSDSTVAVTERTGKRVNKTEIDLERGAHMPDWWVDINSLQTWSPERLGYPTQKPRALLERIISASCPPGGVVLDPFCGCGTTIEAAETLDRDWIGIDITNLAISLIKSRLSEISDVEFHTTGEPQSIDDAAQLAGDDPFQFQFWALGLIGARPAKEKKGADQGIDGRFYFYDGAEDPREVIASVKAGKIQSQHVRDLRGVIEREEADVGVLISLNEPTKPMRKEAAEAGFYKSPYGSHPRIQLITVEDLLSGKQLDLPPEAMQRMKAEAPQAPTKSGGVVPGQLHLTPDPDKEDGDTDS